MLLLHLFCIPIRLSMLPACRTAGEGFALPTFDVVPRDVKGFMEELWEFQAAFHDCSTRSEPRAHFFDYMVGQFSQLERKPVVGLVLKKLEDLSGSTTRDGGCARLAIVERPT